MQTIARDTFWGTVDDVEKRGVIMKNVLVVGSLNMDFDVYMERRPLAGETVMARNLKLVPGGKGGQSGVCAGKIGRNDCDDWCRGKGFFWSANAGKSA